MHKLLICATASLVWATQANVPTLDLRNSTAQSRLYEPASGTASGGGIGSSIRPRSEIKLMLENAHLTHDASGEKLDYQITLENLTDHAIEIPWDSNPRDIEPSPFRPYEFRLAEFGLLSVGAQGQREILQNVTIYGTSESHTLQEIKPHDRVEIRAAADARFLREASRTNLRLRAFWSQSEANVTGTPPSLRELRVQKGSQIESENVAQLSTRPSS